MASVFLATQHSFQRPVAIKVLAPSLAMEPRFAERFMHEARTVASLNHPHIVPVHDVGEHQGYYYLSMEYLTGGSLKDKLADGIPPEQAEQILRQLAAALDYAGQHGFIHRDVKPDNVMFRDDGSAVLMDFGIAANVLNDTRVDQANEIVGTPRYMSPEQHRALPLCPRSDLYSLGCLFYEMLTGKPPYSGNNAASLGEAHGREPIPLLPIPLRGYQPLLRRMMAKDREQRPARGAAVIDALNTRAPAPSHYQQPVAHYRPTDTPHTAPLEPRLRLKEVKVGRSWRGSLYQYDIYLVADNFEQFQGHFPVLRSALLDWHQKRGKRCQAVAVKATLHPWISGRVKDYLKQLRRAEGLEFLAALPMAVNLVAADGEPIERREWPPETEH